MFACYLHACVCLCVQLCVHVCLRACVCAWLTIGLTCRGLLLNDVVSVWVLGFSATVHITPGDTHTHAHSLCSHQYLIERHTHSFCSPQPLIDTNTQTSTFWGTNYFYWHTHTQVCSNEVASSPVIIDVSCVAAGTFVTCLDTSMYLVLRSSTYLYSLNDNRINTKKVNVLGVCGSMHVCQMYIFV